MIEDRNKQLIIDAVRLVAKGYSYARAAKELDTTKDRINWFRRTYRELWQELLQKEQDAIVKTVRAAAGTDAILADPDLYFLMVKSAEKITGERGEPLFNRKLARRPSSAQVDPRGEQTLSEFFENYYVPLSTATKESMYQVRLAITRWRQATGDPPLREIDSAMLARFKKFLSSLRGVRSYKLATPRTVKGRLVYVQSVLDKAGQPGPRNRDAAGVLDRVPWIRPPKVPQPVPKIVSAEHLSDCYLAAVGMEAPKIDGFKPAAWWRALLVLVYNTGIRRGTLLDLRMTDIDWKGSRLVIPPERMKSGRAHVIHLNKTALEHLRKIRTAREYVFEWPGNLRQVYLWLHKLQDLAGIPKAQHFGLHTMRKTTATRLWEYAPQAAQLALGHAGSDVTIRHYVQSEGIVPRALDALPQPAAFNGRQAS